MPARGRAAKAQRTGKSRTEAPAGTAGVKREKKKRSEMTDAEKLEEMKRHRAQVLARRTLDDARDKWIAGFRTPIGHRFGHKRPKDCSRDTGGFSMILPKAAVCGDCAQEVFNSVYHNFTPDNLDCERRCKKWVLEWLQARHFGDARMIPHIHLTKGEGRIVQNTAVAKRAHI